MTGGALAVYVHWPFCLSKCPYCDFNSFVATTVDHDRWRRALVREIDHYAEQTPGRTVGSVFFGGGTPSLMEPATTAAIIERIAAHWSLAPDIEITLEANPTSVEADKLRSFRAAGVNRVSLGVQALNAEDLAFLGRKHSVDEALAAVELAGTTFPRMSFDLITARPQQSLESWRTELARALDLAGDHLSLYHLTIEEGTAFHPLHARGAFVLPDEDLAADLFEMTQAMTAAAGLPAYEISNHARPGGESRHNLAYWRYQDYLGIGPGAHGRLTLDTAQGGGTKFATRNRRAPDIWLKAVEEHGVGAHNPEDVAPDSRLTEALMMGLRLVEGVPLARLTAESGRAENALFDPAGLDRLSRGGFVTRDNGRITATSEGRQRLGTVLATLLE